MRCGFLIIGRSGTNAWRNSGIRVREIRRNLLPVLAAINGFEKDVGRVINRVRIDRRKDDRLGAFGAVVATDGDGGDVLCLPCAPVVFRDFIPTSAVDDIWVERVGRYVAILDDVDGV